MKQRTGDEQILLLGVLGMLVFVVVGVIVWLLGPADEVSEPDTEALGVVQGEEGVAPGSTPEVVGRLPEGIPESSGIAVSRADSTLLWTHNDGPDGRVFLIRRTGELVGVARVVGESVEDTEDIAVGPCPEEMAAPSCLYLADTGDNSQNRESYAILFAAEPEAENWAAGPGELDVEFTALPYRYPDGSHDAEALTVSPSGELLVITKGQEGSAEAFRIAVDDQTAVPLGALPIDVGDEGLRPTGAALSPSGSMIVVRSDEALFLFSADDLSTTLHRCDLPTGRQGEGVDFISDTLLVLTSEGMGASIEIVSCP